MPLLNGNVMVVETLHGDSMQNASNWVRWYGTVHLLLGLVALYIVAASAVTIGRGRGGCSRNSHCC